VELRKNPLGIAANSKGSTDTRRAMPLRFQLVNEELEAQSAGEAPFERGVGVHPPNAA
jgi:hypothetical protein